MRGKDASIIAHFHTVLGSPPLARERHNRIKKKLERLGITPACAGKTDTELKSSTSIRDHPRLRGKDCTVMCLNIKGGGITPACAGKTALTGDFTIQELDHPRLRGKDVESVLLFCTTGGSPPLARERPTPDSLPVEFGGITPACAGKT